MLGIIVVKWTRFSVTKLVDLHILAGDEDYADFHIVVVKLVPEHKRTSSRAQQGYRIAWSCNHS